MTAPTQPTEDVTCVVKVNLRRPAVIIMIGRLEDALVVSLMRPYTYSLRICALRRCRTTRLLVSSALSRTKHPHGGVARGTVPLLCKCLCRRSRDLNGLKRLGVFRLERRREPRHAGTNLGFQFARRHLVRLELARTRLDGAIRGSSPSKVIDGCVP
jgi:hypothetical protein